MSDPISTLLAHVNLTLPDSLSARLELLQAMHKMMTPKHPAWKEVCEQIHSVQSAIRFQVKAQLKFQTLIK